MSNQASPHIRRGDVAYEGPDQFQVLAIDPMNATAVIEHSVSGLEYEVRLSYFSMLPNGDLRVDTSDAVRVSS
jgi:hypothetical protein